MEKFLKYFEQFIISVLILIMVVIVVIATLILASDIIRSLFSSPIYLSDAAKMLDILGYVLLILIAIELLETIKLYLSEHIIHVEVVLEVALIAVARKVILLDYSKYPPLTVLAIAALILALSVGFFLEKRGRNLHSQNESQK